MCISNQIRELGEHSWFAAAGIRPGPFRAHSRMTAAAQRGPESRGVAEVAGHEAAWRQKIRIRDAHPRGVVG